MILLRFIVVLAILWFTCVDAKRKKKSGGDPETPTVIEKSSNNLYENARPKSASTGKLPLAVERVQKAKELHAKGLERAMAGEYNEALPHMRAAVRMNPSDTGYLNDLGVTEMRVGQYQKAKWRFMKAVELDPSFKIGADNIADLKKYMSDDEFTLGIGKYPQKHHLEEPPELDPTYFMNLSVDDDVLQPEILGAGPICIRGAAQAWGWDYTKLTLDHIKAKYGKSRADYYPHNMAEESVHPIFFPLEQAIEQLSLPLEGYMNLDTSEPGTYIQWNVDEESWRGMLDDMGATLPPLFEDKHWTDKCFNREGVTTFNKNVHWKMMLIAEKDAGMFNHKDVMRMASWQVQITGRKLWHICSPTQDPYVYSAGKVNTFKPDYERYPKMINASCYQTITNPGDAMYYPRDWWHQTRNLETPSIAFSGSMVSKHCQREFAIKMREQCYGKGNVFRATPEHCAQVDQCIRNWDILYEHGTGELPADDAHLQPENINEATHKETRDKVLGSATPASQPIADDYEDDEDIAFHDEM